MHIVQLSNMCYLLIQGVNEILCMGKYMSMCYLKSTMMNLLSCSDIRFLPFNFSSKWY